MPGRGGLTITGQLGDVMKESAQAALSYVRANAAELFPDLPADWFADHDIHIHVPAGAIPKDGPSAGVAMVTALASLLSGRPVRADVAMTGEVTLTGQVLPIGGLKEKALAAQRDGIQIVIAPALNEQDIDEIPRHLRGRWSSSSSRRSTRCSTAALAAPAGPGVIAYPEHSPAKRTEGDQWHQNARKVAKAVAFNSADLANITKANPYIQRLIEDSELRDNVTTAIDSSKSAYDRLPSSKAPHKALFEDKKLQKDLRTAAEASRTRPVADQRAQEAKAKKGLRLGPQAAVPRRRRRGGAGRLREAPLQGARHAVRCRGGVPVHAAGPVAGDAAGEPGHRRLSPARRQSIHAKAPSGRLRRLTDWLPAGARRSAPA